MIKNKKIIAIIPARGGSKTIPHKNIVDLDGYPLIAYSIIVVRLSKLIDRVIVSTDSQEIAEIAKKYGAEVPFLRPKEYAGDLSPDIEFFKHAIDWFRQNEGYEPEYFVHVRPTTPLREPEIVDQAIEKILNNKEATSLRSAHELREPPHKFFKIENNFFKGLFPEDKRPGYHNLPRQVFPSAYHPNGYVDVVKSQTIINTDTLHGTKILPFITPEIIELDRPEDLNYIKFDLNRKKYKIKEFLKNNFNKMTKYKISYIPKEVPEIKTRFRQIKTKIPVLESVSLLQDMQKYEVSDMCIHELPIVWDRADDFQVYDRWGNKWIDFTSGIFVANVGHCAKEVSAAIVKKVDNKLIHSYVFPNDSRVKLAKKLCKITQMDKTLLVVTGSEANDAAIQMMQRNRKGKILSIDGAYYGGTTACRLLSKNVIDELMNPDKINPTEIAGVFLQTFRGRDAKFMPYDWIRTWCKWAQENDIPVGFDEMQSGFGRTGKWFGYQNYDVQPDFITVGKALGGGLPISAVIGRKKLLELSDDLWSTHTGNPICCAAALASLEIIENQKLVEKTAARTDWFGQLLKETFPNHKIYGQGMIWALYTGDAKLTQKIIEKCAEKGLLLVSTYGPAIKIGPPLTIPDEALIEGIKVIEESFEEVINEI